MGQLQSQNQEGNANTQEAAWWCKLLARTVGAVGGASKLIKINLERSINLYFGASHITLHVIIKEDFK